MTRFISLVLAATLAGCAGDNPFDTMAHRDGEALIGAGVGAAIGAIAYDRNRTKGALVGAVGGALAGGVVGRYG